MCYLLPSMYKCLYVCHVRLNYGFGHHSCCYPVGSISVFHLLIAVDLFNAVMNLTLTLQIVGYAVCVFVNMCLSCRRSPAADCWWTLLHLAYIATSFPVVSATTLALAVLRCICSHTCRRIIAERKIICIDCIYENFCLIPLIQG